MDTLASRLQEALDARNLTPPDLISRAKFAKGTVYNILNGDTKVEKVRGSTIRKIGMILGVSSNWLLTGAGSMDDADPDEDGDWAHVRGYAQSVGLGTGPEAEEYAETHKLKFRADSLARKRLNPTRLAVMYGAGDSMEPRIRAGDAILFDQSDVDPRDGQLYVIMVPGAGGSEYNVKRCEVIGDLVLFRADNPAGDHNWRSPKRKDDERLPIQIIGRVRWIGSWEG